MTDVTDTTPPDTLLDVSGLGKSFGPRRVLDGLSFTVRSGIIQSIIGPNGAGKTTLFNLITGVLAPTAGSIRFGGREIGGLPSYRVARHGIARTFQNVQVFFNMTALENVMLGHHLLTDRRFLPALLRLPGARRAERACRDRAAELMRFVGLERYLDADTGALPYGALKRLEIARALAMQPRLLLLDEPAAGLNPTETDAIDRLIQEVGATGVTVLLVEHDMRLVQGVSEHILVIDHGRRLAGGSWEEIRHNPDVVEAYLGHEGRNR